MDNVGYGARPAAAPVWGSAGIAIIAILQAFEGPGVSACGRGLLFCSCFAKVENHHEIAKKTALWLNNHYPGATLDEWIVRSNNILAAQDRHELNWRLVFNVGVCETSRRCGP